MGYRLNTFNASVDFKKPLVYILTKLFVRIKPVRMHTNGLFSTFNINTDYENITK